MTLPRTPREHPGLLEALVYDESSPTYLRWKADRMGGWHHSQVCARAGEEAGSLAGEWPTVRVDGDLYYISRVVWYLHHGDIPAEHVVDHQDGNPFNNVHSNLRAVTEIVNRQNSKARSDNTSGICGVGRQVHADGLVYWRAVWRENGKTRSKPFSVQQHGEDGAKLLAARHRAQMIQQLNQRGESYTERHGK